ncbi:MAG TPA: histidinol dehydrogenase [Bacillota bacterium]|jgi:histidinol dehydrogenase|nr:histidinol dehydrogenase [Bacillota bacterium]HOB86741.1 histidinol dehydrogenase [Bacillota bacterium]HOP69821.1 histidinol dehydrogenase [Bacillota bacterium]HPT34818.1 histidinol dehydrogenase [Bacillota bacterium]HPZ64612.1 histidinol dehydrogenase [Bacillota bacterium]
MPLPLYSFAEYKRRRPLRSLEDYREEREQVVRIIERVRQEGDAAVLEYTARFDGTAPASLAVADEEWEEALNRVEPELREALARAAANIERFHRRQLEGSWWEAGPGWVAGQRRIPLEAVGVYVPGGTAAYPSSVLMTVIPARVAGVRQIYLCTPPGPGGEIHPLTLAAAREAGATAVFKAGGAQAIAALAYGTETIPAVPKIVGPGNLYVTLAKREVFGRVGIDLLAGPSEILVVAAEEANPAYIAADMLSQAEHDPLARALLVTPSSELARRVKEALRRQLERLPRREIALRSLQEQGAIILVENLEEAWPIVNQVAPEHLELHLPDPWRYLERIKSAGAIFLGPHTPEPVGDYWAGSNHVLPTGGAARYASPLGVADFMKTTNVVYYTAEALLEAAPFIRRLAEAEGLAAHARAAAIREEEDEEEGAD